MSAKHSLVHGENYPYDRNDDGLAPVEPGDWAIRAARGVLADLSGRSGIGNELECIDEETRIEIVQTMAEIIREARRDDMVGG